MLEQTDQEVWERILDKLKELVSEQKFTTWYRPIRPVEVAARRVVLEVPNPFFVDWFEEHNLPTLRQAVS